MSLLYYEITRDFYYTGDVYNVREIERAGYFDTVFMGSKESAMDMLIVLNDARNRRLNTTTKFMLSDGSTWLYNPQDIPPDDIIRDIYDYAFKDLT